MTAEHDRIQLERTVEFGRQLGLDDLEVLEILEAWRAYVRERALAFPWSRARESLQRRANGQPHLPSSSR